MSRVDRTAGGLAELSVDLELCGKGKVVHRLTANRVAVLDGLQRH